MNLMGNGRWGHWNHVGFRVFAGLRSIRFRSRYKGSLRLVTVKKSISFRINLRLNLVNLGLVMTDFFLGFSGLLTCAVLIVDNSVKLALPLGKIALQLTSGSS